MDRSSDDLFGSDSEDDVIHEVRTLERQQAEKKQSLLDKVVKAQNDSDDESIDSKDESEEESEHEAESLDLSLIHI